MNLDHTTLTNKSFLEAVFGNDVPNVIIAAIPGDPNHPDHKGKWAGGPVARLLDQALPTTNNYFATMLSAGGRRTNNLWAGARTITLDDIGSKVRASVVRQLLGEPSWCFETSPGSEHWGYILSERCDEQGVYILIMDKLADMGLTDAGAKKAGQYFRLPVGWNGKASLGEEGFTTIVHAWEPDRKFALADIARKVGVDLSDLAQLAAAQAGVGRAFVAGKIEADDSWLSRVHTAGLFKDWNLNGTVEITCPWDHEHTGNPSGTAYLGGGNFECHHGHCQHRNSVDFGNEINRLCEAVSPFSMSAPAMAAAEVFSKHPLNTPENGEIIDAIIDALKDKRERKNKEEAVELDPAVVADLLSKYVYVQDQDKFFELVTGNLLTPKGVCTENTHIAKMGARNKLLSPDNVFINEGGEKAATLTYIPGRGQVTQTPTASGRMVPAINRWMPSTMKFAENVVEQDIRVWLDHVAFIFPDTLDREDILNWMAFIVQNPGVKINWAPLIIGVPGTGKDSMFEPLLRAVGMHNVAQVQVAQLEQPQTYFLRSQIVIVQELHEVTGQKQLQNKMKSWLAAPPDMVTVNEKNIRQYDVPNITCWLMFSNEEQPTKIEDGDRRLHVLKSPALPQPEAYYDALWAWYANGGNEKVAGFLKARSLAAFNPTARPRDTVAKLELIAASRPSAEQWLEEELANGRWAGRRLLTTREVQEASQGRDAPQYAQHLSAHRAGALLKKLGAVKLNNEAGCILPDGSKAYVWAVERPELYDNLSGKQIGEAYTKDKSGKSFAPIIAGAAVVQLHNEDEQGDVEPMEDIPF